MGCDIAKLLNKCGITHTTIQTHKETTSSKLKNKEFDESLITDGELDEINDELSIPDQPDRK